MKKTLICLLMFIVLFTTTAQAAEATDYFESFAALEGSHGDYDQWPGDAKTELVRLMREHNLAIDGDRAAAMEEAGDAEEAAELADEILIDYFGEDRTISIFTVMLRELGPFDRWTQEQKVLYSSLLERHGRLRENEALYLMPGPGDLQEEEAITKALQVLAEKFGFEAALNDAQTSAVFMQSVLDYGQEPVWIMEIRGIDTYDNTYTVILTHEGELVSFASPYTMAYSADAPDVDALLAEATPAEPGEHDASREYILSYAIDSLREIGSYEARMEKITAEAHFFYHQRFNGGYEPVWLVCFYENGQLAHKMLFGYDGTCIGAASAKMEFVNTSRQGWQFEPEGMVLSDLLTMSLEEQVRSLEKCRTEVEAFTLQNPYYENRNSIWSQIARHIYGLPGDEDISQEDATHIAQEAIVAQGADRSTLGQREVVYAFDVTDPQNPVWKLMIYHVGFEFDGAKEYSHEEIAITYQIHIHARTGEILEMRRNDEEDFNAFAFLL